MTRIQDVLEIIHGKIICVVGNQRKVFITKENLINNDLYKDYVITSVCSEDNAIVLELQPWQPCMADLDADWAKIHKEQNGFEPSFF